MELNEYGRIVERIWQWLAQQYLYVQLDTFQIMPNHFHGIIRTIDIRGNRDVGTGRDLSLPIAPHPQKIKSLSELIGAFKTTSSKSIHARGASQFAWQRSFHDRIIRNKHELNAVRGYIVNNPRNPQ